MCQGSDKSAVEAGGIEKEAFHVKLIPNQGYGWAIVVHIASKFSVWSSVLLSLCLPGTDILHSLYHAGILE